MPKPNMYSSHRKVHDSSALYVAEMAFCDLSSCANLLHFLTCADLSNKHSEV